MTNSAGTEQTTGMTWERLSRCLQDKSEDGRVKSESEGDGNVTSLTPDKWFDSLATSCLSSPPVRPLLLSILSPPVHPLFYSQETKIMIRKTVIPVTPGLHFFLHILFLLHCKSIDRIQETRRRKRSLIFSLVSSFGWREKKRNCKDTVDGKKKSTNKKSEVVRVNGSILMKTRVRENWMKECNQTKSLDQEKKKEEMHQSRLHSILVVVPTKRERRTAFLLSSLLFSFH